MPQFPNDLEMLYYCVVEAQTYLNIKDCDHTEKGCYQPGDPQFISFDALLSDECHCEIVWAQCRGCCSWRWFMKDAFESDDGCCVDSERDCHVSRAEVAVLLADAWLFPLENGGVFHNVFLQSYRQYGETLPTKERVCYVAHDQDDLVMGVHAAKNDALAVVSFMIRTNPSHWEKRVILFLSAVVEHDDNLCAEGNNNYGEILGREILGRFKRLESGQRLELFESITKSYFEVDEAAIWTEWLEMVEYVDNLH